MSRRLSAACLLVLAAACTPTAPDPTAAPPAAAMTVPGNATSDPGTAAPATVAPASTSTGADLPPPVCTGAEPEQGERLAFFASAALCPELDNVPYPVYRPPIGRPSLEAAVSLLVGGTTEAERAAGLSTGFDVVADADGIEVTVSVDAAGVATVDFLLDGDRWSPGSLAGTTSQLFSFIDPLAATVFAYPEVTALDRSTLCWGDAGCTGVTTRRDWEGGLFSNGGVLFHRDCDLVRVWSDPLASYCLVAGAAPLAPATVVDVTSDDVLFMRSGPDARYRDVGRLAPGATVEVLDASEVASDGGLWRLVTNPEGEVGWVNAAFLDIERSPQEKLIDAFVAFAD